MGTTGTFYRRHCWQAPHEGIDSTFLLTWTPTRLIVAVTIRKLKEISVHVNKKPSPTFLDIPSNISVTFDDTMCIDLFAEDTFNINDTLSIEPYSGNFSFGSTFVHPLFNNLTEVLL